MSKLKPTTWSLFKGVLQQGSKGATTTSMAKAPVKQNYRWEEGLQKLVESYDAPPPPSHKEQHDLVELLQDVYKDQLHKTSSQQPLDRHFEDLFSGLGTVSKQPSTSVLTMSERARTGAIGATQNENEAFQMFDELYYHGKLSYNNAMAMVKNKHVRDIDRVFNTVMFGGSLVKWDNKSRHLFRLQAANRYFALKQKQKARELIVDCFESEWAPVLKSMELGSKSVVGLTRALLAMPGGTEKLVNEINSWASETFKSTNVALATVFIPIWTGCVQVHQYGTAAQVVAAACRMETQESSCSLLFIKFASIIHSHMDEPLKQYLRQSNRLSTIVSLPIDYNQKELDGAILCRMVDFVKQLQDNGFSRVVNECAFLLSQELDVVKNNEPNQEMVSKALALQKLRVLRHKATETDYNGTGPIITDKVEYVS